MTGRFDVSIVVPTCRRNGLLSRCIAALAAQEYNAGRFEIIIADDAADEETRRLVEHASRRYGLPLIRYIPVRGTRHGPAAARNAAWKTADSGLIAFTDDDCLPEPLWLARGAAAFTPGTSGAWGRIVMPLSRTPTDYELTAAGLEKAGFVTANCFVLKELLVKTGGFDERFTRAWREDSDLFFTLMEHQANIVYVEDAVVVHPIRPASWGVSVRQQKNNRFEALLYKKHPALYERLIRFRSRGHYYPVVGALSLTALFGLAGFMDGALVSGTAWAAMTARFCLMRLRRTSHAWSHVAEMAVTSALIPPVAVFWRLTGGIKSRTFFY